MSFVIPRNTAIAVERRVPFVLVDATDLITPEDIDVTGVKVALSFGGAADAPSTNDIVKVDGPLGMYYIELTQTEANNAVGPMHATLAPPGCARTYIEAMIGPGDTFAPGVTDASVATAVWAASTRSLTTFGTLVADVWAAATRTLTAGGNTDIADALLNRDMATGTDSGSTTVRTVRQALRTLRNRFLVSGGTVTFYKEDDSTVSHTAVLTGTPAVTEANPPGGA